MILTVALRRLGTIPLWNGADYRVIFRGGGKGGMGRWKCQLVNLAALTYSCSCWIYSPVTAKLFCFVLTLE